MTPAAGVALMMNNYFHDVATALLVASAFALRVITELHPPMSSTNATFALSAASNRSVAPQGTDGMTTQHETASFGRGSSSQSIR